MWNFLWKWYKNYLLQQIYIIFLGYKARDQANSFGFPISQAGPKAILGQKSGLAWPGFWPQARAGTSLMWVFWIQIKYFIVSLPRDEKIWNVVNTLCLLKGSDCAFFQIFPMTFKDFAKFSGYISLYVLFLMNGLMNHIEIWPWALPN